MKKLYVLFVLLVSVIALFTVLSLDRKRADEETKRVAASDTSKVITSQVEWQQGVTDNLTSTVSGEIEINDPAGSKESISGSAVTADYDDANKQNALDGDCETVWDVPSIPGESRYWQADFGSLIINGFVKYYAKGACRGTCSYQYSSNGVNWYDLPGQASMIESESFCTSPAGESYKFTQVDLRYFRVIYAGDGLGGPQFSELEIYGPATATHTSASTQITHNDLYQWQTFTPTYTKPANTTVSFRLRTSTDANTWTSWTAYQTPNSGSSLDITSLVTSKTGDAGSETFYKYIQVETKLTSSDGTSNPTVDDYSIGYHTNVVPNKPVGATVTMGS